MQASTDSPEQVNIIKGDYPTCGGYNLKPRQDLAYHRFTQFCNNNNNKGMFLLHNVGTGKTLTSLQIALTTISKEYAKSNDALNKEGKIVVVAPTGIFDSAFVTEFKSNITGVESVTRKKISNPKSLCSFLQEGDDVIEVKYFGRKYKLYTLIYKHLYRGVDNMNQQNISSNTRYDYHDLKRFIHNSVVIFDEAHRMLRPGTIMPSLCYDMIHHNVMDVCMKYVVMTGTPINSDISDVKTMVAFCITDPNERNKILDITGREYGGHLKGIVTNRSLKAIALSVTPLLATIAYQVTTDYLFPNLSPLILPVCSVVISCVMNWLTRTRGIWGGSSKQMDVYDQPNFTQTNKSNIELQFSTLRELLLQTYGQVNTTLILKMANIDNSALKTYMVRILYLFSYWVTTSGVIDNAKLMQFMNFLNESRNDGVSLISTVLSGNTICAASVLKSCDSIAQIINSAHIQPWLLSLATSRNSSRNSPFVSNRSSNVSMKSKYRLRGGQHKHTVRLITGTMSTVAEMPTQLGVPYFTESVKRIINFIPLINVKAFAKDVKKYTSLYDIATQIEFDTREYKNRYNIVTLANSLSNTEQRNKLLPAAPARQIPIYYPKRLNCKILCPYDEIQIAFGTLISGISTKHQAEGRIDMSKMNEIFSTSPNPTKYIGNFSSDVVHYKCIQLQNGGTDFRYVDSSTKKEVEPSQYMYECMKFKSILIELLFMRTGYMKCGGDTIIQPHFTDRETNTNPGEKLFTPMVNESGKPYILSDFKNSDSGYRYLPIVYSTSDVLGLGLFAGYLKGLGFKYILLHDNMQNRYKDEQRLSGYSPKKMKPLPNRDDPEANYEQILSDVQSRRLDSYDKETPLCVLISEGQTEGIDFKYNPAIFLMEVPNNCCDAEQLAGRVLRSYPSKMDLYKEPSTDDEKRDKVPVKIVCQMLCETWNPLSAATTAATRAAKTVAFKTAHLVSSTLSPLTRKSRKKRERSAKRAAEREAAQAVAQEVKNKSSQKMASIKEEMNQNGQAALKLIQVSNPNLQDRFYYNAVNLVRSVMNWDWDEYNKQETELTIFRNFLYELNKPFDPNNTHLHGVGDLEQSLICTKDTDNHDMCEEVTTNTDDFYRIFMNPDDDNIKNALKKYCMYNDISKQQISTLRLEFNPRICQANIEYENELKNSPNLEHALKNLKEKKRNIEAEIHRELSELRRTGTVSASVRSRSTQKKGGKNRRRNRSSSHRI